MLFLVSVPHLFTAQHCNKQWIWVLISFAIPTGLPAGQNKRKKMSLSILVVFWGWWKIYFHFQWHAPSPTQVPVPIKIEKSFESSIQWLSIFERLGTNNEMMGGKSHTELGGSVAYFWYLNQFHSWACGTVSGLNPHTSKLPCRPNHKMSNPLSFQIWVCKYLHVYTVYLYHSGIYPIPIY